VEYESITKGASGKFLCTGSHPTEGSPAPLEFTLSDQKLTESVRQASVEGPKPLTKSLIDDIARKSAEAEAVIKGGNSRYA
jgi:hypothetical protein